MPDESVTSTKFPLTAAGLLPFLPAPVWVQHRTGASARKTNQPASVAIRWQRLEQSIFPSELLKKGNTMDQPIDGTGCHCQADA